MLQLRLTAGRSMAAAGGSGGGEFPDAVATGPRRAASPIRDIAAAAAAAAVCNRRCDSLVTGAARAGGLAALPQQRLGPDFPFHLIPSLIKTKLLSILIR